MSNRTVKYTAGEIGHVKAVKDFLPSPDALEPSDENVKVTLQLSRRSVDYFKRAGAALRILAHPTLVGGRVKSSRRTNFGHVPDLGKCTTSASV